MTASEERNSPRHAQSFEGLETPYSMNTIATHWSVITGHDVKAGKVAVK